MRTTILHVLDHSLPIFSGYSFRSDSIVRFQSRQGFRPVVLTSPKHGSPNDTVESIDGLRYYRARQLRGRLPVVAELRQMARMARRIATVARKEHAAVIHAHSPVLNGLPALWAARRLKIPVVYEARAFWEDAAVDHGTTREGSPRYRATRALETWLCRVADRVVTICDGLRNDLMLRGIDGRRITVVPNGVNVDDFHPRPRNDALARKLGLGSSIVLGFIGSFYSYEGLRFLAESAASLRRALPRAKILLVGGGEDEAALRAHAASMGDLMVMPGRVPHTEIAEFYSVIDVFVCPRRRMRLTELVTPLKPLEAMAMAKPVLASDVGGHRELINHDATGVLFQAESTGAFVGQAARLGSDPGLRAKLGAAARRYVASERTWERIVSRYSQIYAEVA